MKTNVDLIVSDLFFNYSHEHYDALYVSSDRRAYATRQDQYEAILQDAKEFIDNYGKIEAIGQHTAKELADDFMARL